jgi:hypothetical protein
VLSACIRRLCARQARGEPEERGTFSPTPSPNGYAWQPPDSRDEFDGHGRRLTAANTQTRNSPAQPARLKRT